MDIFDEFATDEKLEIEGAWVDYDDKTRFRIAREYNDHFQRVFSETQEKHSRALKAKTEEAKKLSGKLMIEIMAKTILLGWEGPVKVRGVAVEYSFENAVKLLEFKGFRGWVASQASTEANFKAEAEEADAKN